jgi:hypothetical protein
MPLNITPETPRAAVSFAITDDAKNGPRVTVQAPQPYSAGHVLTEGEASQLNQVLKENMSNNLRERIKLGVVSGEGENQTAVPHTDETAQTVVDKFFEDYEMGVRRGGGAEARVTDPVEREAKALAKAKVVAHIKSQGFKPSDVDVAGLTLKVFEANRDMLMAEGKKIVKARENAAGKSDGLSFDGLDLGGAPAETEQAAA